MPSTAQQCSDCAIIGGGPGGLTAAIYLARFNRQVLLLDAGQPRASWSPRNRNYPGFPEGLSGQELLDRFAEQARAFKVAPLPVRVTSLERSEAGFLLRGEKLRSAEPDEATDQNGTNEPWCAEVRRVILATGLTDFWPEMQGARELRGHGIRVCPICDAYEANEKRIGILGSGNKVAREALYLTSFTCRVVLFTHGLEAEQPIDPALVDRLCTAGVHIVNGCVTAMRPCSKIHPPEEHSPGAVTLTVEEGREETVDMLFSAMGSRPNSQLAAEVGARLDEQGCVLTDRWQATSVDGLFAIGDVTFELSQVAVAVGQAATAATAVHNSLLDF